MSEVGLGMMGMTVAYGPSDYESNLQIIKSAVEEGITLFDTAEVYGQGTGSSEILLGKAVSSVRDSVVLATKFGYDLSKTRSSGFDSRPENIRKATENSLAYLNTDYIDVLFQHRVDPDVPIEDVAGTVGELISEGKVKFFGLSEAGPETISRAHAVTPVSVVQSEYSVIERDVEEEVLPTVNKLGIGFVAYSPIGRGLLAGVTTPAAEFPEGDLRRFLPRWQPENLSITLPLIHEFIALANAKKVLPSQLALAWILGKSPDYIPIVGMRQKEHLAEILDIGGIQLSEGEISAIDALFPNGAVGQRYPDAYMPIWV
ncbi:MAG: hypothetical protein RI926_1232 [Actinomycetota bacterium]